MYNSLKAILLISLVALSFSQNTETSSKFLESTELDVQVNALGGAGDLIACVGLVTPLVSDIMDAVKAAFAKDFQKVRFVMENNFAPHFSNFQSGCLDKLMK